MRKSALILAPHPDDESITGLLPLRLREEGGFRVEVLPATLGSRPDRRFARCKELKAACRVLGFRVAALETDSEGRTAPSALIRRLQTARPDVMFLPHALDGHVTHQWTHRMGVAAMDATGGAFYVVETEYWHPLRHPNLMVTADACNLETLQTALAQHVGEVARNEYAARLPAWMVDNVRRGAELIGGAGSAAPAAAYATLYRLRKRQGGKWHSFLRQGCLIESSGDLAGLISSWV
ncbi:MAG: PIG-L family deacetylase [Verrucomicrobiota bacterium]|nr:PIG-L family deacetylase [Verrucomicrobiota bacterium]